MQRGGRGIMKQVGLIGYPVAHSRSPQMHNAAFQASGIDAWYELWETPPEQLEERIASLRSPEMLGANVTIPYKEQVVSLLDECDALATRIGAVNTIVNRDGRLVGYNTDAPALYARWRNAPVIHLIVLGNEPLFWVQAVPLALLPSLLSNMVRRR